MAEGASLITKLQVDATDSSKSVADLLRLAKVAATKLGVVDALIWIDRELDGYSSVLTKDLPPYRRLHGTPKAWNAYRGWQSIMFADPTSETACSYCPIGQSVTSLEAAIKNADSSGSFTFSYPPELAIKLRKAMNWNTDVHVELEFEQIHNIVDQVRNLILNWSLELEKAGVVGEAMKFTEKEKSEAVPITQHYFIQNVGVLGNVGDQAFVSTTQNATFDLSKVGEFLAALRASAPGLPAEIREKVLAEVDKAQVVMESPAPDRGVLRAILTTIGSVCEGAAANLTAAGILIALHALVGGTPAM